MSDQVDLLFREHHSWIYQWLRQRLNTEHEAEDLTQDTFLRILSRRQEHIKEPRAYLTTVAKGILINWYQRQSLERAYLEALSTVPESDIPSEEQHYLVLETLHEIDVMLDALPTRTKQAFLMAQVEGMTYQAIAYQLDVSVITVKRDMKKAFAHCLLFM